MKKDFDWSAIITRAKDELVACFAALEPFDLSEHDAAVFELSEKLAVLEKARPAAMRREVVRERDYEKSLLEQAWRAGFSADGNHRHSAPYHEAVLSLGRKADWDPVAFDALALHATGFLSDGRALPVELRVFASEVLLTKKVRPTRGRGYKVEHARRDQIIAWVVITLGDLFNISPTRNDESTAGEFSACDAVAEALAALCRPPQSYSSVKKIWMAAKAERAAAERAEGPMWVK